MRIGDLGAFAEALDRYGEVFMRDRNYKLILRVRLNVIKAGVRRISSAYSSISLSDISDKLQLGSAEDAEYIIAKVRYCVVRSSVVR